MSELVTLICWDCGEPWELPRRRGQYPLRCTGCSRGELGAKSLARRARDAGLVARAVNHAQQGWVCTVVTPWHELPVILRDDHDLRYLQAELRSQPAPHVDHRLKRAAA